MGTTPDMILTSVDFPAPLSPSRPTTSPLADVEGHVLEHRVRTVVLRHAFKADEAAAPGQCAVRGLEWAWSCRLPFHELVEYGGDHDRQAEEQLDVEAGRIAEYEAVLDDQDQRGADDHADDRTSSAG